MNRPLGVLALRIDPETYLYPFIKRWPTPSLTAETLLVRRDGNDALFLNDLKFQTNTALNLRISLANTNVPAVKAILGEKGFVEGVDYRGVPTLAALHAIPDSPWFLVARMDTAEVYAPLRERLRLTILLVSLLLISAGLGIGAIWRHQRAQFYKERYEMAEALRCSETKFRTLYDSTSDAVMLLDEKGFFDCNPATLAVYGCATREEFCSKHPADVSPPVQPDGTDSRTLANQRIATAREKGTNHFEWIHQRADTGETFTADVLLNAMELDGKPVVQAVVRDITERKRVEEAVRASETRYRRLFEAARDGILILDAGTGRVVDANPFLTEILGLSHKEFLGKTIWELGFFKDIVANQARFEELQKKEYIRYEDLPLKTSDGRRINVEFVSNVYLVNHQRVIQCNIRDITERKRMEESLRHERTLMATLMDNIPAAVYFKDAASRFIQVNRAHSRKFGMSDPAQLTGKSDADFFSGEHAQQALADEREIIRTGQPLLNVEEKETWLDGTVSWVVTSKMPLRDTTGRIIGTCGISLDITDRKQMEQALAERKEEVSQRNQELADTNATLQQQIAVRERIEKVLEGERNLLRTLIDNLPDYVYAQDAEGRFVVANAGMARQLGFLSPNEIVGKSNFDLFPHELAARYHLDEQEIIRTGKGLYHHEGPTVDASKQEKNRWVSSTKVPLRNDLGEITGFVGLGQDITERKLAEESLRESQVLYYSLAEQLPVGVFRKDREGRFILVNPEFCRLKGMKAEEFLGKTPPEVATAEAAKPGATELAIKYAGAGAEHHEQIMQTGKSIELDEEYANADGRKQFLHVIKLPVVDPDGKIIGTQGIQFDITERKLAEEALQQSSKELQARNDELARFTYTVSHDLKSPLVTIKAFLGYLEQDTLNQDTEAITKDRQYIYSAVDKMSRLLDELLDLARIGSKMNPLEEVPLQVVVKDALDMVAGAIIQKGVEVVATKESIMLCGDRTRLVEVFQNLVDNAIKFMGNQPNPRVEIGVEKTGEGNVFFVRDNGMGIEPRYQAKVFNLFEKYDPKMKGTGIGLALVKRIVEVHGGKIWVESAGIGKGATFRFTLAKTQRHPVQP